MERGRRKNKADTGHTAELCGHKVHCCHCPRRVVPTPGTGCRVNYTVSVEVVPSAIPTCAVYPLKALALFLRPCSAEHWEPLGELCVMPCNRRCQPSAMAAIPQLPHSGAVLGQQQETASREWLCWCLSGLYDGRSAAFPGCLQLLLVGFFLARITKLGTLGLFFSLNLQSLLIPVLCKC